MDTDEQFLRGLAGPRHWTEDDARRVLALWEASGLSRSDFARRHRLRATRLAWWERRLGEWGAEVESDAADDQRSEGDNFIELVPTVGSSRGDVFARLRIGDVELELTALDASVARFVVELARLREQGECC
ncbi:MAG: hypothetical protein KF901_04990 [Myxococcales bacterium]|nr:hypothetical protein [Myxococcales bacterium]